VFSITYVVGRSPSGWFCVAQAMLSLPLVLPRKGRVLVAGDTDFGTLCGFLRIRILGIVVLAAKR
jgi:hypothetical protein